MATRQAKSKTAGAKTAAKGRWSQRAALESNALDLEPEFFTWRDLKRIAASLKHSAEASGRRKSHLFRSAMSTAADLSEPKPSEPQPPPPDPDPSPEPPNYPPEPAEPDPDVINPTPEPLPV